MARRIGLKVPALLLANALAFGLLIAPAPAVAVSGGDYCNENDPEVTGCGCLSDITLLPDGCHEGAHTGFYCSRGGDC